ncbi:hypothetical protein V7S43_009175 [Phytophthora oleae]|uniref:Uncharacterized protein n=1 Tax=Phytophthora oleae TaxID=2107226 RepID=A0ABD3FH49_9STRA
MPRASNRPPQTSDQRFIYLDLDSLLSSVRAHVLSHEAQFHRELASFSSDVALCPKNLTVLLNDQQPSRVQCWKGTYCNPNIAEAKALEAVRSDGSAKIDWKLTQKGTSQHPTLEKMLKKQLKASPTNGAKRTLVLAAGALSEGLKSCVDAYLKAQWHVQLVTLDLCYKKGDWQFTEIEGFCVKSVDKYLKKLLTARHCLDSGKIDYQRKVSSPTLHPQLSVGSNSNCSSPVKPFDPLAMPLDYTQATHDDRRVGMLEQEMGDIERRKARLAELSTSKYLSGNRQRYVFMNLDNIAGAVCNSQWLYQRIVGARSGYDVRLNFRQLTQRVCGPKADLVKRKLASYRKMPRELALPLQTFDWEVHSLSPSPSGNRGLYYVLLDLLETAGSAKHKNVLVLVMGDGALGGSGAEQKEATKDLLTKFLDKNWYVEIHSWLHALNDWFLDIQELKQYQSRVTVKPLDDAIHDLVYLKQDEEEVWVEPVWPGSQHAVKPVHMSSPVPHSPPPPSAWGATAIPTLSLFPTTPLLTMEQKLEQRMKLEDERKDLLERLCKNQEALDALEMETWSMQILQQQELARLEQQTSDKQLAIRMAEEEEMQLKLLREYEDAQEEEPWQWA